MSASEYTVVLARPTRLDWTDNEVLHVTARNLDDAIEKAGDAADLVNGNGAAWEVCGIFSGHHEDLNEED